MLEPVLVDTPTKFPQACFVCTGQTGPFIDWQAEKPGGLHLYTCARCNKESARVSGFGEGERLDELETALETFDRSARDVEIAGRTIYEMRGELELKDKAIEELEITLEAKKGRIAQLEEQLHTAAAQLVA
jgi:hypothetical protein